MKNPSARSLQDLMNSVDDWVGYLYNDTIAPHCRVTATRTPVPLEFSNWREEQRAWRETAILFDQSHHMPELFIKGPDASRLLNRIGVNSFANLAPNRAKQFVGCNSRGQIIGDCVLHNLEKDRFELVSGMPLLDWVQFQAEKTASDVVIERDNNTADNPSGRRRNFRFGMDGPNAEKIFTEVVKGAAPDIPFFCTARVEIAGCDVLALRHGMAGHKGVELSGDYAATEAVRAAILQAGTKYGIRRGGTRAYFSSSLESGWIGYPLPAIYSDEDMQEFREWLPADGWEAQFQLGGSFYSHNIADYYVTPFDMGYGTIVKFDHDFIGRSALERLAGNPPRTKVTLVWNSDDVSRVCHSMLESGTPCKYIERPVADYALAHTDEVRLPDGRLVGVSTHCGYSMNEREMLSLAIVDRAYAAPGTEVALTWGEPGGGSRKPRVERHRQAQIRARVAAVPYARSVEQLKRATIGKVA